MDGPVVEVEARSVLAATAELRRASKLYSAAGWRLSTSLPLMPPPFLARVQVELDVVAARLQALAARLDVDAAAEAWRMSVLVDAGAGDVGAAVGQLVSDLGGEGRAAWDQLCHESGPQTLVDPLGGNAQVILGGLDAVSSTVHTAATLAQVTPAYAAADPAGAARARQEVMAMAVNLLLLSPEAATIDPQAHRAAVAAGASRLTDAQDLAHGNVPRWVGHIGAGLLLTALTRGLAPADEAIAEDATTSTGLADVLTSGYEAVGAANRVPTDRPRPSTRRDGSAVRQAEDRLFTNLAPIADR